MGQTHLASNTTLRSGLKEGQQGPCKSVLNLLYTTARRCIDAVKLPWKGSVKEAKEKTMSKDMGETKHSQVKKSCL